MWLIGGVLFGILAAVYQGSFLDRGIVGLTLVAYALPPSSIAVFLLKYVAVKWQLVPYPGYVSIADGGVASWLGNLFLPSFTLALVFIHRLRPNDPRLRA